ncbi:hypothetical protein THRCLA_06597 [Thraustotheca clavata]|uniref:EF-hand domain-containing protein n=1 Tax=Thraustotheca clavata TaxID=74557 RepID=A0A1V9ZN21_9STRA|nr:hypothetical protein THRCLA_06597 [Thraustotheca clavata]
MPPPAKKQDRRAISSIGQTNFQVEATQSLNESPSAPFDIRQFLLEKKATQSSFLDPTLFRTNARESIDDPMSFARVLKKKQLPRMDSAPALKSPSSDTKKQVNQEETLGYRLYSIENMTDASLHAIRSQNKTWQTLRASDLRLECPCKRSDVLDLEQCFEAAMNYAKGLEIWEGDRKTALIDRDYMAVQSQVVAKYAPLNEAETRALTCMVFEQKWTDIIIGELEAMLMVSFFEQGTLLRKVRNQYALTYYNLEMLYGQSQVEKKEAIQSKAAMRSRLDALGVEHNEMITKLKQHYEDELSSLHTQIEIERSDAEKKTQESRDQVMKMSETMKTLNGIFKQMREDSDKVRAIELKETNQKLEKKCESLKDEIDRLRSLIPKVQLLEQTTDELTSTIQSLSDELNATKRLVHEKDNIIEDLLHRQEQLLAREEIQASKAKQPDNEIAPPTEEGALCSRCRGPLDDGDNSLTTTTGTSKVGDCRDQNKTTMAANRAKNNGKRVHCLSFRILLPNLQGRRPTREPSWAIGCIRAILYSKQVDDMMCLHGGMPGRLRMAEFVYAWFAPLDADLELLLPEQRDQAHATADEARWCLYYGAKLLSKELTEAKLFLSFLDEKHGDDEATHGKLHWSPLRHAPNYNVFSNEWQSHFRMTNEIVQIPKTIWISLTHASRATALVLSKATADERVEFEHQLQTLSTTELAPGEHSATAQTEGPFVDAAQWLQLMLQEYREEQAHRRAAIRLMFQTASAVSENGKENDATQTANSEMDMEQFRSMMLTLHSNVSCATIVSYFRLSYDRGDGHVTFDAFMETAEERQFFAQCMNLTSIPVLAAAYQNSHGINTPAAILGSMVAKHFTLFEEDLYQRMASLPPYTQALARRAFADTVISIREGRGSVIDGFRAIAEHHRLLTLQLWHWLARTELAGEVLPSSAVVKLDKALSCALECFRHTPRHSGEALLELVRKKISVYRVQKAFRARLTRDQGVPLNMRQLMHEGYGSGKTSYRYRRVLRPTKWLLNVISDLIRTKAELDDGNNAPQTFIEYVYDYFAQRFGSRWEAEKVVHDVFVNTRTLAMSHARILLFSQLCGMGASGEDQYYGSNEAFNFLSMVLHAGYHSFPLLCPTEDLELDFVKHENAVCLIQAFFGAVDVENHDRMLGRLRELEHMSSRPKTSDADGLLLFLLEEWRRHVLNRMNQVRVMCCADKDLLAVDGYLSVEQLLVVFRRSGISMSDNEAAQIFRKVLQAKTSPLSTLDRIVKYVFPIICQEINVNELLPPPPADLAQQVFLTLSYWEPYQVSGKDLMEEMKALGCKNDADDAIAQLDSMSNDQAAASKRISSFNGIQVSHFSTNDALDLEDKFKAVQSKMQRLIAYQSSPDGEELTSAHITEATVAFRQYLSECTRLRGVAKLGIGPMRDDFSDN